MTGTLPEPFAAWFAARGWTPRPHQLDVLAAAQAGESVLLIAPTGGGKTLAGFLPSLVDLHANPRPGMHTLYVSPLKALAADIARNLTRPVADMSLDITIDTRTGDTSGERRRRQREAPPNLLLTTPESLALLVSLPDAPQMFASLAAVVVDEVHALAGTKRGDQLALCLARLSTLAPGARRTGLSATVAHRQPLVDYVSSGTPARVIEVTGGAPPEITMILPEGRLPWSGHMGLFSAPEILARIRAAGMTIVFVNTRAQAELLFQELWKLNDETLPIAIHHGSLELESRKRVEAAMAEGRLRAVVATSSLDLGIDWGGVDQVLQVGAPKGVSRLLQRVGRANHRMDEASRAILVPANRFEVLECEAAILGVAARELDGDPPRPGGLDVLAQHLLGVACSAAFHPDAMFAEVRRAAPYADLTRQDFDAVLGFVEDGGYALSAYERYRRLFRDSEGRMHVMSERVARTHRMNIGTIVEEPLLKVRHVGRGGGMLGEVEEYFVNMLSPGDTFMFAGRLLRFLRLRETVCEVTDGGGGDPKVPAYAGGRMPMTTNLADRVRAMLQDPATWHAFPEPVQEWLRLQKARSRLPGRHDLLVETFPRGDRWYLVAYCFEGRNAHQTLGMLLTRRMERFGFQPLGFVATDYVLATWSAREPHDVARLFEQDMLGDDLEAWMAESSMLRRTFRNVAVIAGLIERHHPGAEKTRRQVTVNSDLIYNVLRRHQPDHILLRATRADAAGGLTDVARIAGMLARAKGRIRHMVLSRVSPLAVPVLLDIGRESVRSGESDDDLLAEAETLVAEATGTAEPPPFRPQRPAPPQRPRPDRRQGRLFA
ncbi:ligase-associated DNA damage response DEXH box helicase [Limobrevibacterium gyesilva]|uniref:Ligase-associated DNA damage response DEXH box helicase n=1 Tax=Limobrevibacterium gyesilva TaxID=2991712 RepID=A0AA41YKQ9_9PROT|nr:ligase-associated DNA damage response DEXH box helicase [Limobrevibacterium gyesilva]MCW3474405.1 ligase-associated DNA damage response DEXH box helicase [Limobrevibacterium gyesilva]